MEFRIGGSLEEFLISEFWKKQAKGVTSDYVRGAQGQVHNSQFKKYCLSDAEAVFRAK